MPISALNFFWLTDPHDLQGIPTPLRALSYVLRGAQEKICVKRGKPCRYCTVGQKGAETTHPHTGSTRCALEAEGSVYRCMHMRCRRVRPGQRFCVVLSETGSFHRHVIAHEVSRVATLHRGATPPGFVAFGWGVTIKTGAFDADATAV